MATVYLVRPMTKGFARQMHEIWPEPYASPAAAAYAEDWTSGQIFLLIVDWEIVGVTGFFLDSDSDCIYLRWTGIVPKHRRKGYAAAALMALRERLKPAHAGRKLVELVPDNEYGVPVKQFFLAQGFQEDRSVYTPPNECSDWPVIPMSITI